MITHDQILAARKLLGWSAVTLAINSGKSILTIARAEGANLRSRDADRTLLIIRAALEAAGIEFTDGKPGVKLRENP